MICDDSVREKEKKTVFLTAIILTDDRNLDVLFFQM